MSLHHLVTIFKKIRRNYTKPFFYQNEFLDYRDNMRIVFDLDGVICELKKPSESYSDVIPKKKIIQKMRNLKEEGHYLIIHTARHMKTCEGDVTKVIEKIGKITEDWLEKWQVPYDEIIFGKPYADAYIDDLGIEFSTNEKLGEKLESIRPTIVIPMAGEGKRFKDDGILEPKYMIKIKDKTLFEWSVDSLPINISKKIIFVCLEEHEKKFNVSEFIKKIMNQKYPNSKYEVIYVKQTTGGQVETVLHAKHLIRPESSLIIYNIDTYFVSTRLKTKIITLKNKNIDGLLGCFKSNNENLSFIKLNEKGFVEEVKEKEKISDYASTGLYMFTKAKQFFEAGENMIKNKIKIKNEYYVSEIYNMLLKSNAKFEIDLVDEFSPLGTPDELKKFEI